jgi:hypothetical protein
VNVPMAWNMFATGRWIEKNDAEKLHTSQFLRTYVANSKACSIYYGAIHLATATFVQGLCMRQSEPRKFLTLTLARNHLGKSFGVLKNAS